MPLYSTEYGVPCVQMCAVCGAAKMITCVSYNLPTLISTVTDDLLAVTFIKQVYSVCYQGISDCGAGVKGVLAEKISILTFNFYFFRFLLYILVKFGQRFIRGV